MNISKKQNIWQKLVHFGVLIVFFFGVFPYPSLVQAETPEEKALRKRLLEAEQEILQRQEKLQGAKKEQGKVQGEVNTLSGAIKKTKSKIYQKEKEIKNLSSSTHYFRTCSFS